MTSTKQLSHGRWLFFLDLAGGWLPPTVDSKPDSFHPRASVRLGAGSTYFLCAMFFFAVLNASSTLSQLEYTGFECSLYTKYSASSY